VPRDADARLKLDYAERWLRDGLAVLQPPLSVYQVSVDMSAALQRLDTLRRAGVAATTTHLLVSAAAKTLAANPQLHQIVAGTTKLRPSRVDIGLSVSGESFVAPVLIIENAGQRSIEDLVQDTAKRTPEARRRDGRMLRVLRRWGWVVPVAAIRRSLLKAAFRSPTFRRKGVGTFQVSTVPVEWAFSATFSTAGVLIGGQVAQRVAVVDGAPAVRPMMALTLSADHGVWDGRSAAMFMVGVKDLLEAE
jgi:pyruvate/2-oxoglutarate dehydrogenase complex dihydrolipoamide acyltransferase (E2) component